MAWKSATNLDSRREQMSIVDYVREEVERQGHDTRSLDGVERVGWMMDAWSYALHEAERRPEQRDVVEIGKLIERDRNKIGIRDCTVWVGDRKCPGPGAVPHLLIGLFGKRDQMTPLDFYRRLLEIHPFLDGNGRTGKVILNWLNGTLLQPIFPPSDFWGHPIRNP